MARVSGFPTRNVIVTAGPYSSRDLRVYRGETSKFMGLLLLLYIVVPRKKIGRHSLNSSVCFRWQRPGNCGAPGLKVLGGVTWKMARHLNFRIVVPIL